MSSDDRIHQMNKAIDRAELGRQVLKNSMFSEAFNARRAKLFADFGRSSEMDDEERRELARSIKNLDELELYFVKSLNDGKIATKELSRLQKAKNLIGL